MNANSAGPPLPQIALIGAGIDDLVALEGARSVDWLACRPQSGQQYDFLRGGEKILTLDMSRPVCGLPDLIAVFGVSGTANLAGLQSAWQASDMPLDVAFESIEDGDPNTILSRALYHVGRVMSVQMRHAGRMALELATYRREFERMQHSFAALEGYVAALDLIRPRDVFDYPRSAASHVPCDGSVRQLLPLNSLGIAGISVAFAATPGRPGEKLAAVLSVIETGATLASWSLDPLGTPAGWTTLSLDRAIDEMALSLVLTIHGGPGCEGWRLLLGPPHPYSEFCATTGSGESLGAPMAMRVTATLPGTRVSAADGSVRPDGAPPPATYPVAAAVYETVSEVFPPFAANAGTSVHYNDELGFIQVHPRGSGAVTVARLLIAPPENTWRLSAVVCLGHEEANPTQFGILVRVAVGEDGEVADVADGAPGFSGWLTVTAMEQRGLSVVFPPECGDLLAVYLLTRQVGGAEFAWARFSDMRFHALPGSVRPRSSAFAAPAGRGT
jgi:hypothetical protein